jgi:(1->4)-alpha-D-glucan 1-alpha-D-glucosylmutase
MVSSTYRLQISDAFTLFDAAAVVPYLNRLGVDWLYLSPILEAEPGSTHGYDVVDHSRVDPARGGAAGLETLATAAHGLGMGVLVDIVPNHVGIATAHLNRWWWDVLEHGPDSAHADYFDIDWLAGGERVLLPVLGESEEELDRLLVDDGELVYYEHRFPIAPGTESGTAREIHDRQHYELVSWRRADHDLNYRRFFAVSTLAAVRVEEEAVFEESHTEIRRWLTEGLVDGLRIDHPDGLRDPSGYLKTLTSIAPGRPIWVEKILEGDERIPLDWPVAGTTGYESLAVFDRVLVDPDGELPLTRLATELEGPETGETLDDTTPTDWPALVLDRKRRVAETILNSEIRRLVRDTGIDDSEAAIIEIAAAMPVYRSYLPFGLEHVEIALASAARSRPDLASSIGAVGQVLTDAEHPAAKRFQQTSGMIMAKGVEDNAYYRFTRLTSLNEVGANPADFAATVARFHEAQTERSTHHPSAMTTLTTHDTKRSEDTRSRIAALAEVPDAWRRFLTDVRGIISVDDGALENLVWQAVLGAWPASRQRLTDYALKAAREAGNSTSWTDGDADFEERLASLVASVFDAGDVREEVEDLSAALTPAGYSNGLSLKLLQLMAPGTPDVYQGTERWDRSLVDPDNRRPVDFAEAAELLRRIDDGWLPPVAEDGAAKLLLTSQALRLRRDHPELFTTYRPISADGPAAEHLIAFDRGGVVALATRLPIGLNARGGWGDTAVELVERPLRDALTGAEFPGGRIPLAKLFASYPVALVVPR